MLTESEQRRRRLVAAGRRLTIDAATAELFASFRTAGVSALLLKGRSIADWLYRDGELRVYQDADVLVPPTDMSVAKRVLADLSYRPPLQERLTRAPRHAGSWFRSSDGVTVDMHRTIPMVRADDEVVWRALSRNADTVTIGGREIPTLSASARGLHIALHVAQHGDLAPRPFIDLERALALADGGVWDEAAALAVELGAVDAFSIGLRCSRAGARVASRLGLPEYSAKDVELHSGVAMALARSFEQLARARGVRARLAIIARQLLPPAEIVRDWDRRATHTRAALLRTYLRRLAWMLRSTPLGLRAWLWTRRSTHTPPGDT